MEERRSALLVATADYGDEQLKRLRSPVGDARMLHDVLADARSGGFDVTLLANRPSYEIRERIEGFFTDRAPDETLLLYFSCHGVTDTDGRLYFATTDTRRRRFRATAIEAAFVQDCVHGCRSRRIVLILDCCHSGAFPAGMTPKSDSTAPVKAQLEGRGHAVLTSSDALEYSFEVDGDRVEGSGVGSAFTAALAEGLRTGAADLDGDGWISVDELYEYTYRRVRETQPAQTPRAWIDVQGQLFVARSVQPVSVDALPPELREVMGSSIASARSAAVSELAALLLSPRARTAEAARLALVQLCDDDSRSVQVAARAALQRERGDAGVPSPPPPPTQAVPRASRTPRLATAAVMCAASVAALVAFSMPWLYQGSGPSGVNLIHDDAFSSAVELLAICAAIALLGALGLATANLTLIVRMMRSPTKPPRHSLRILSTFMFYESLVATGFLLAIPPLADEYGNMAIPYWLAVAFLAVTVGAAAVDVVAQ